jgi:uncharacterized membrane protein YkoI
MTKTMMAALAGLLLALPAGAQTPDSTRQDQAPRRVLYGLRSRFPKAEIQKWTKEKEGNVWVYDFEFTQERLHYEADVAEDGTIRNWEVEMSAVDLPARVQQAVTAKYPGGTITRAMRVTEVHGRKDSFVGYEVEVRTTDGRDVELILAPDGRVIEEGS